MEEAGSVHDPSPTSDSSNTSIPSEDNSGNDKPSDITKLTDAGSYAYAGLAASILALLYEGECEKKFRHDLLDKLSASIDLLEKAKLPLLAVADGEMQVRPEPFIDLLMDEIAVKDHPEVLLSNLLLVAVRDGCYDARTRQIIEYLSRMLRVDISAVEAVEEQVVELLKTQAEISDEEKKAAAKRVRRTKVKRGLLIGLATVVGGTIIGVTGGLAAPLIATGMGTIIGAAGGAALGSVAGVAIIGSLFGVAGAGLTGFKMKKRVGGIEQFEFDILTEGSQMTLTIAINGWISKGDEDFRTPWMTLDHSKEQYYLKYEGQYLKDLGQSLDTLSNMVVRSAVAETLKYTALSTIISAVAWPATLLSIASVIDNPWHVCTQRAENSGKQLAEVLLNRQQGHRPVTLIGFSLGARVIFYALRELAKSAKGQGIVENAYLLGAPVSGKPKEWEPFKHVIAGKIVNAYIKSDWLLKFLYRTASVQFKIAGTGPVMWDDRRMININLTDIVHGHMDYMKKMSIILDAIGIKTKPHPLSTNDLGPSVDSGLASTSLSLDEKLSSQGQSADFHTGESQEILTSEQPFSRLTEEMGSSDDSLAPHQDVYKHVYTGTGSNTNRSETTDSDGSLTLKYDQFVDKDSNDSVASAPSGVLRTRVVKEKVGRSSDSEQLLSNIEKCNLLADEESRGSDSCLNQSEADGVVNPAR